MKFEDLKRPGGTSGGLIEFLVGLAMTISGRLLGDKPRDRDERLLELGRL